MKTLKFLKNCSFSITYLYLKKNYLFLILFVIVVTKDNFSQSSFIKNEGQWNNIIKYKSDFSGGKLYLEDGVLNYNFLNTKELDEHVSQHHKKQHYDDSKEIDISGHCLKTSFLNSNKNLETIEINKIDEYFNYYIGNDAKKWATKVRAYKSILYKELYKDIDLRIDVKEHGYKYDFILRPNADISKIKIEYQGADKIALEYGNLKIYTSVNDIIEESPKAYQVIDNEKTEVACNFVLEKGIVSFEFPDGYNPSIELIIDPYIVFSRISGSFADNFGYTATFDSEENAYGAGSVFGNGFITTPGAYDETFNAGSTDIGIIKYSADGINRLFSTYIGGANSDLPHSLVVNSRDELFLLGTTSSSDFPIDTFLTCFDPTFNGGVSVSFSGLNVGYTSGSDMIVARFNSDGTNLLASTFLGGTGNDGLNYSSFLAYNYADEIRGEILMDENDNCFVVSCTNSTDFPVGPLGVLQMNNAGGFDAVVVKMDENLTNIIWSTYIGGSEDDAAYSLDFDVNGNIALAGGTHSENFPMVNAYQDTYGGADADGFVSRLHSTGMGLLSSTYYGSDDYDQIYFVELNDYDEIHIFGQTKADTNQLVYNAIYNQPNGGQFLAKFNTTSDTLIWATRFGDESGVPDISPTAFLVDVCNRVFLSGWGWSGASYLSGTAGLEVTADALDNTTDNSDFYFMVIADDASSLIYGSYFGGPNSREHVDGGTSRFDKKGVIYQAVCASCGGNSDFPVVPSGSPWSNGSSNCNLGVVKYAFSPPSVVADFSLPNTTCAPTLLNFENQSQTAFNDTSQAIFIWSVNNGVTIDTIISYHLDYNFLNSGVYDIILYAIDTQSCNFMNSLSKELTILGNSSSNLDNINSCLGNLIQIGILPINGDITYNWSPNYFLSATDISNPFANPPEDTTYQLIISNGTCSDTLFQKVVLGSIDVDIIPFDSVCLEQSIELHTLRLDGALYEWTPDDLVVIGQGTPDATIIALNSNQTIGLTVTNLEGCSNDVSVDLMTIDDLPDLNVIADPDTIEAGASSHLFAESLVAISYQWEENDYFETLEIENPIAENILETTTFKVEVDNGVCPKLDSVIIYVVVPKCLEGKFYVPNAFSPNGDNNNDIFKVRTTLLNIENFYFAVFDRWGNIIFETTDITNGWDGTYKNAELSPNVYGWYTSGICPDGEDFKLKGNVTLLK